MKSITPVDSRFEQLRAWLAALAGEQGLDPDSLVSAAADAGQRRYFRVNSDGAHGPTLIAMDAPPPEKCREFVMVRALLAEARVHVPQILAFDLERGFMLLTDLGTRTYLDALAPQNARTLMREALDTLLRWQLASRENVLPRFDATFLRREMELMPEWYMGRHLDTPPDTAQRAVLEQIFETLSASALAQPQVFMHRDFMPRNLMVTTPNPGVLDFQDAVYGPITYDVASLLRDAFIEWDEGFQLDCIAWYWERAAKAGLPVNPDFADFYRDLEWMGLQRHLKILGLFARLAYRDGKPRYLAEVPRFVGYARKVAERYVELTPLARLLDQLEGRAPLTVHTF